MPRDRELHSAALAGAPCKTPGARKKREAPRYGDSKVNNRVCPAFVPFDPEASCKECLGAASVSVMPPKAHLPVAQSQSSLQFLAAKLASVFVVRRWPTRKREGEGKHLFHNP